MKVNIGPFPLKNDARTISVQVDKYDTYSLDDTLSYIILPLLHQLRHNMQGVPSEFGDVGGGEGDSQQCFEFYSDTYKESFDESCTQWYEILDKMIWSFQQMALEDYESLYHHGKPNYEWVETDTSMINPISGKLERVTELVDKNPSEHWYDLNGHNMHEDRIQEGIDLFAKYFRSLWD